MQNTYTVKRQAIGFLKTAVSRSEPAPLHHSITL
jgi:hypothetical protein